MTTLFCVSGSSTPWAFLNFPERAKLGSGDVILYRLWITPRFSLCSVKRGLPSKNTKILSLYSVGEIDTVGDVGKRSSLIK